MRVPQKEAPELPYYIILYIFGQLNARIWGTRNKIVVKCWSSVKNLLIFWWILTEMLYSLSKVLVVEEIDSKTEENLLKRVKMRAECGVGVTDLPPYNHFSIRITTVNKICYILLDFYKKLLYNIYRKQKRRYINSFQRFALPAINIPQTNSFVPLSLEQPLFGSLWGLLVVGNRSRTSKAAPRIHLCGRRPPAQSTIPLVPMQSTTCSCHICGWSSKATWNKVWGAVRDV